MKQLIWRLKYKRTLELAELLAKPLHDCLLEEMEDKLTSLSVDKIILIPVPLSPARYRSRGYNQAEELAKQLVALNPEQFEIRTDIVKKIKDTPTQVSIRNREARLRNLKGAFALCEVAFSCAKNDFSQGPPAGKKSYLAQPGPTSHLPSTIFVIIDDVSTTGATIGEIRRLLTMGGANPHRLYGLVVAHG